MADLKFKKIASLDEYPRANRLSMTVNLMTSKMEVSIQGRDAKDEEIGTALWLYHGALNTAEAQIEQLLKIIRDLKSQGYVDADEYDYEESYEEDGDEDIRYKLDEYRAALFSAMHKKDEQKTSYYLNLISVVEAKMEKEASNV